MMESFVSKMENYKFHPLELLVALGMAAAVSYAAYQTKLYVKEKVEQCARYQVCKIEDIIND